MSCLGIIAAQGFAQPCTPLEEAVMVADDGEVAAGYGWSVAIDGNIAVVGAVNDDGRGSDSGSVYILEFENGRWDEIDKIVASDVRSFDRFGDSVAISGNTMIIGAPGDDDAGSGAGAAYVYERVADQWIELSKLVPEDGQAGDNFGSAVDIDQGTTRGTIIIGAMLADDAGTSSGKAYIYTKLASQWVLESMIQSEDIAETDRFGIDVAVSGDRVVVGADSDDDLGSNSGAAYVFERVGAQWLQSAKLLAADGIDDDQLGERVDISGDAIIAGARYSDAIANRSGSAYVFEYDNGQWSQHTKLTAYDGSSSEYFGQDVAIHNGRAIVGAWGQEDRLGNFNAGAAYAYSRTAAGWTIDRKLIASDRDGWDFFGYSVDVSDEHAIIGADGNDDFWWGPDAGAVYLHAMNCDSPCAVDLNGDAVLNFFDVSAFLSLFGDENAQVDFDENGEFNFFDVSHFLSAFSVGCP